MSTLNTSTFDHMPFPTLTDVLVRDRADVPWERAKFIFRRDPSDASFNNYTYVTDTMQTWAQCIPLAGNEHLENTSCVATALATQKAEIENIKQRVKELERFVANVLKN